MNSMSSSHARSQQDDEIDLSMVFHQLWENKWLIVLVMAVTLTLGVFYASQQVPQYQSELLLQIKSDNQGGAGVFGALKQQLNFGGLQKLRK
jgi:uncharacterized protein involved in exopolysaccharide biosynthesis